MERTLSQRLYRFGPFELSVDAAELRRSGLHLKLQDQPFHILCTLLEHPGELVTREQLRQQLWPEGTFVDFEHGLNTAIKKIRDVLNDDADTPRYIETIPRKGYRFIAPLNQGAAAAIVTIAPPASLHRWRFRAPLLMAAVVIAIAGAFLILLRISQPPHLQISATKQLTVDGGVSPRSAIETDGRRVYYFKYADGHLYSVPVSGGAESSNLTRFVEPLILHISPDGSTLLVHENTGPAGTHATRLWLLPTNGGPARPLGDIEADSAAWSPDGKTIAFAQNRAINLTENEGATYRRLADTPGDVQWIRWSPDGLCLRLSVADPKTRVSSTWEADRSGKLVSLNTKLGMPSDSYGGIWTKDGQYFLFRRFRDGRNDYWVAPDKRWPLPSGKAHLLSGGGAQLIAATASPLENTLFVVGNESSLMSFQYQFEGRRLIPYLQGMSVMHPVFSADGKWMAAVEMHNREYVLWRARGDGSEWLQLTDPKLSIHHARFSPDGTRLVMMAKWPDQPWKVYWISVDGGALHELNVPIASQADPNWMPDNQSILFGQPPRYFAEPDAPRAIYIYNLQTNSNAKVPGSEGWFAPRISPDGRRFLALSIDMHKLAVYEFSTSQWRVLLGNARDLVKLPFWSLDGKWAYYNIEHGKSDLVMRTRLPDGAPEQVLSLGEMIASPECWGWLFTPDGTMMISCIRNNNNIYALKYE